MVWRKRKINKLISQFGMHLVAYGMFVAFMLPYFYMVLSGFKTRLDLFHYPPKWIFTPTLENYSKVLVEYNLLKYIWNSVVVSAFNVPLVLLIAFPSAYSYARMRPRFKEGLAFALLFMQMVPPIAIVFALFNVAKILGLVDNLAILVIVNLLWGIPFAVWMLKDFIAEVPVELEEAALVDGCSLSQAITKVTIPLISSGFTATAIMVFIHVWNEFVYAFFLTSINARTLPTTIEFFLTYGETQWGFMFAAASLSTLPVVLFGIGVRTYFVRGQTYGALKG
jgi:multiple sugar transport system permease protein